MSLIVAIIVDFLCVCVSAKAGVIDSNLAICMAIIFAGGLAGLES